VAEGGGLLIRPTLLRPAVSTSCPSCASHLVRVVGRDSFGRVSWHCGQCNGHGITAGTPPTEKERRRSGLVDPRDGGSSLGGLIDVAFKR